MMFTPYNEQLLKTLAVNGEMEIRDFLKQVDRSRNDYTDFYGVAAMLHGGYISTDTTTTDEPIRGALGIDSQCTAITLCQIALEPGQFFIENKLPRESWYDFSAKIFITIQGLLKLEELERYNSSLQQKRFDYLFTIFVAIFTAIVTSLVTNYFQN